MHHDVRDSGFVGVLAAVVIQVIPHEVAEGTVEHELAAVGDYATEIAHHDAVGAGVGRGDVGDGQAIVGGTANQHAIAIPLKTLHNVCKGYDTTISKQDEIRSGRICAESRSLSNADRLIRQRLGDQIGRHCDGATTEGIRDAIISQRSCDDNRVEAIIRVLDVGNHQTLVRLAGKDVRNPCHHFVPLIGVGDAGEHKKVVFAKLSTPD